MDRYCSINSNKWTLLVCKVTIIGEVLWGEGGIGEHSVLSAPCFSKSKTLLKKSINLKKKEEERRKGNS